MTDENEEGIWKDWYTGRENQMNEFGILGLYSVFQNYCNVLRYTCPPSLWMLGW